MIIYVGNFYLPNITSVTALITVVSEVVRRSLSPLAGELGTE